ncbi:helix-turn-helix domain-containing protein [Alteromonadaceae bacterium M269]|nr:helix-turn-helix domain-containing protein [Alteromonadaceae bacterium M269]
MIRTAILTYHQAALFELGCAVELFSLERPEFDCWYQTDVVSLSNESMTYTGGIQIQASFVESLKVYDFLVIPSWPTDESKAVPKNIDEEITRFYNDGKRIVSFCSGAFLVAKLGILDGKEATTHWRYAESFKTQFPHVKYVEDVLYTYDGKIGCSAGSSSAIDLGLEVIRNDYGHEIANKVARRMVLSAHRKGGQSQYAETPLPPSNNQFSVALDWALSNLSAVISIDELAQKANMSRRTFDRKFRANLNITPKDWLTHQRLNRAKSLLEERDYSIERIAEECGFDNATTMRHHFRKEFGIPPNSFRQQFRTSHPS